MDEPLKILLTKERERERKRKRKREREREGGREREREREREMGSVNLIHFKSRCFGLKNQTRNEFCSCCFKTLSCFFEHRALR